jgi:chromosome segregation ATPase
MDSLDLDQVVDEIIPRGDMAPKVSRPTDLVLRQTLPAADDATAALALVSEAAEAIRKLEEQSAHAVSRAHGAANAVMEKLERTVARAERAESALRQAESEISELTASSMQQHKEIDMLQACLADREAELAAIEQRLASAERRAEEANAAIQRIVTAIRTQLPITAGLNIDGDD